MITRKKVKKNMFIMTNTTLTKFQAIFPLNHAPCRLFNPCENQQAN